MTRPLPNCAHCGTPLKKAKGRCILKFGTPGKPNIGWCDECDWGVKDPEFARLKPDGEAHPSDHRALDSVLAAIEARGPNRVVWSKANR